MASLLGWIKKHTANLLIASGVAAGVIGWAVYSLAYAKHGFKADVVANMIQGHNVTVVDWEKVRNSYQDAYKAYRQSLILAQGAFGFGVALVGIGCVVLLKGRLGRKTDIATPDVDRY